MAGLTIGCVYIFGVQLGGEAETNPPILSGGTFFLNIAVYQRDSHVCKASGEDA